MRISHKHGEDVPERRGHKAQAPAPLQCYREAATVRRRPVQIAGCHKEAVLACPVHALQNIDVGETGHFSVAQQA